MTLKAKQETNSVIFTYHYIHILRTEMM